MIDLPTPPRDSPYWETQALVSGVWLTLTYRYQFRRQVWLLDVALNGAPQVTGALCSFGVDLFARVTNAAMPQGNLLVYTRKGFYTPTLNDWADGVAVIAYFTPGELSSV